MPQKSHRKHVSARAFFSILGILFMIGNYCLFCAACQKFPEKISIEATSLDNQSSFTLDLPGYLSPEPNHKLNPRAKIQYCNYYRNIYFTVLDTAKSTIVDMSLQQYATRNYQKLINALGNPSRLDSTSLVINNMPAIQIALNGDLGGSSLKERIYYRLLFVESPTHYYQLVYWGWDKNRDKFLADINSSVASFRQIISQNK